MNGSVHGRGRFTFIYCHLLTCLEPSIEFMYVFYIRNTYILFVLRYFIYFMKLLILCDLLLNLMLVQVLLMRQIRRHTMMYLE